MQNFISFFMVLIFFENLENFRARLIIYQKCPSKRQLFLAGYAQIFVPEELSRLKKNLEQWMSWLTIDLKE